MHNVRRGEKVATKFGLHLETVQSKQSLKRGKFAQSGHPDYQYRDQGDRMRS
jgi:hypothetical protein